MLEKLQLSLVGLEERVSLLPRQVRKLASQVDALAAPIAEPRYREVLRGLLHILDLVRDTIENLPEDGGDPAFHRRNYEIFATQLFQTLITNGLEEIPVEGRFDPSVHEAKEVVDSEDPTDGDRVLSVLRPGFRAGGRILRYAEVRVGRHVSVVIQSGAEANAESEPDGSPEAAEDDSTSVNGDQIDGVENERSPRGEA